MGRLLLCMLIAIIIIIIAMWIEALFHYYQPHIKYRKDEKLLTLHWNLYNKNKKWVGRKRINIKLK